VTRGKPSRISLRSIRATRESRSCLLHSSRAARRDDEIVAHTGRFQFVRDGFHWWALLLTPFWMLRYRMWLELIAYLSLVAGITMGSAPRYRRERRAVGRAAALAVGRS